MIEMRRVPLRQTTPRILIVAGSDSSGGAGIQADIKTVAMLGGYAMTAITAVTAQNTKGVSAVEMMTPELVGKQIDACVSDIGVDAVKTGMLGGAAHVELAAERLSALSVPIVVDPVMVSTSGARLIDDDGIAALHTHLLPRALVVAPNAPELAVLTGREVGSEEELTAAAKALAARHGIAVFAKGGHIEGREIVDLLVEASGDVTRVSDRRIDTRHTHGTGCTLASAMAMRIAAGDDLASAAKGARAYVRRAIEAAPGFGAGSGPLGIPAADSEG